MSYSMLKAVGPSELRELISKGTHCLVGKEDRVRLWKMFEWEIRLLKSFFPRLYQIPSKKHDIINLLL